jgi:hypothetical protein
VEAAEMTDKEKRIEEMSRHVCASCDYDYNGSCGLHSLPEQCHKATNIAEVLYEAGYRKQVEGEWEERTEYNEFEDCEDEFYQCSECELCIYYTPKFCPNCGAKMKGGE